MMKIPVVINNFNQFENVREMAKVLLNQNVPVIIIDNASSYIPLLSWYEQIKNEVEIIRNKQNFGHLAFYSILAHRFEKPVFYTDSDIILNPKMPENWQEIMLELYEKHKKKISLALKIDDIPKHYPFRNEAIRNERKWWRNKIQNKPLKLYVADTDTTFSLINPREFSYQSIRIGGDFTAKHSSWYQNPKFLTSEQIYYINSLSTVTQYSKMMKKMIKLSENKISCVMCTYGRFQCVERSISMFLDQDYPNKELIIFNTAPVELKLSEALENKGIVVVNNEISYETGKPYTNIGDVRGDSLHHVTGNIYVCWDDDDLYLPFHLSMNIKHLLASGKKAFKPKKSYFSRNGGKTFEYCENNMEASILVFMDVVKSIGMRKETGSEHLGWLEKLRDDKQIVEDQDVTPFESYCFNWGDSFAPHKQSGNIGDPNNFENHKKHSIDFGDRPLRRIGVSQYYQNILYFSNDPVLKLILRKYIKGMEKTKFDPQNVDLYATHMPMLEALVEFKKKLGNVVEFGMGNYSTKFLLQHSEHLVSFEMQSSDWYQAMLRNVFESKCSKCKIKWTPIWSLNDLHCYKLANQMFQEVDLVFVDGHQDTRPECANQFMNKAETIIMHDTEYDYGWKRLKIEGYYSFDFKKFSNWTTVLTKNQEFHKYLVENYA